MPTTTKVKTDITTPTINVPLNRSGTHKQAVTPIIAIGNTTYMYKADIKSPSKNTKKFFILSPLSFICNSYDRI